MDFGLVKIFDSVMQAAGWKVAVLMVIVLLVIIALIRLAPSWFTDRRTRDLASSQARAAVLQAQQARIDAKDAMLEKILTNHIAHLEIQLEASREFYSVAAERLASISQEIKESRRDLEKMSISIDDINEDTTFLKGKLS
jgi:hypothetical protein